MLVHFHELNISFTLYTCYFWKLQIIINLHVYIAIEMYLRVHRRYHNWLANQALTWVSVVKCQLTDRTIVVIG